MNKLSRLEPYAEIWPFITKPIGIIIWSISIKYLLHKDKRYLDLRHLLIVSSYFLGFWKNQSQSVCCRLLTWP